MLKTVVLMLAITATGLAQVPANVYLREQTIQTGIDRLNARAAGSRDQADIRNVLPLANPAFFSRYVQATLEPNFSDILAEVDAKRLNKFVGGIAGESGSTSLLSKVSVPSVLGFAVEYGGILQRNDGMVTTLQGNLLGLGKLAAGEEQFPYCPEISRESCPPGARWLRRFSANSSFEQIRVKQGTTTVSTTAGPTTTDLFGNDYRMSSWGIHVDLTGSNNLSDPKFIKTYQQNMKQLGQDVVSVELTQTITNLFSTPATLAAYQSWQAETVPLLQAAPTRAAIESTLAARLELLVPLLSGIDTNFARNALAVRRAFSNFFLVQDQLIKEAQTQKFSVEYRNLHPSNEPNRSNVRLIYSHQPTDAPAIVTINATMSFYHNDSPLLKSKFRDVQLAAQLDRKLTDIPNFGRATLTLAGYYQWMKEDALISIGTGSAVPGIGIVLPGTAAKLLGSKGGSAIAQAKISLPIGNTVKIPLSVTWANRAELIKENSVRGQVGFTLDVDQLFH